MNDEIETAREDLAFMRALAQAPDKPNRLLGQALFAAGLIYGFQTLTQWAADIGVIPLTGWAYGGLILACNLLFFAVLAVIILRERTPSSQNVTRRAYEAAFQATGLANLCIVIVFGAASYRSGSGDIWYFYCPLVFAMQGAAWFIFFRLRKRAWLGTVAVGWFASAIALGLTTHSATYILVASISLFTLLAIPGWVMMQLARKETA